MKRSLLFFALFACAFPSFGMKRADKLMVASYSSFAGKYGPGRELADEFTAKTGIDVELVDAGSGADLAVRLSEGGLRADVVLGINDIHIARVRELLEDIRVLDYGYYAFCLNLKSGMTDIPRSLRDLAGDAFEGKFILIDPRTSDVGCGLLEWAVAAFGEEEGFRWMRKASENALAVAPSWSFAYSLFLQGEAPMVISYSTSPVYHLANGEDFVVSLEFDEGAIRTEEYMAVCRSSRKKEWAVKFMDFIASRSVDVALANSMYPAGLGDGARPELPAVYGLVSEPSLVLDRPDSADLVGKWTLTVL